MQTAFKNGSIVIAKLDMEKGGYSCRNCGSEVIACGYVGGFVSAYFRHKDMPECDTWDKDKITNSMSAWHKDWQCRFPLEYREVTLSDGKVRHRADIGLPALVIEYQHSPITKKIIEEREFFYTDSIGIDMIWVVDGNTIDAFSKTWLSAKCPVWIDYGSHVGIRDYDWVEISKNRFIELVSNYQQSKEIINEINSKTFDTINWCNHKISSLDLKIYRLKLATARFCHDKHLDSLFRECEIKSNFRNRFLAISKENNYTDILKFKDEMLYLANKMNQLIANILNIIVPKIHKRIEELKTQYDTTADITTLKGTVSNDKAKTNLLPCPINIGHAIDKLNSLKDRHGDIYIMGYKITNYLAIFHVALGRTGWVTEWELGFVTNYMNYSGAAPSLHITPNVITNSK